MNLAVCLAGCLDVTPLKSLLQVVPSCVRSKSVRLRTRVLEKACAQKVCARKSVRSKKERAERILTIFGGNFEMDLKSKRSSLRSRDFLRVIFQTMWKIACC